MYPPHYLPAFLIGILSYGAGIYYVHISLLFKLLFYKAFVLEDTPERGGFGEVEFAAEGMESDAFHEAAKVREYNEPQSTRCSEAFWFFPTEKYREPQRKIFKTSCLPGYINFAQGNEMLLK